MGAAEATTVVRLRPVVAVAVVVGALAAATGSMLLALASDHVSLPALQSGLFIWISISYVLCGLVAWHRRPESRFGPLMIATGFGTALSNLAWANDPVVAGIGLTFDLLPLALFLHVFLAYPDGRLNDPGERGIVVAGYGIALVGLAVGRFFGAFGAEDLFAVVVLPTFGEALYGAMLVGLSALCLAALGILWSRRRSLRPRRRTGALIVDAFMLGLLTIPVLLIWGLTHSPGFSIVQRLMLVVMGLAPVAFLVGLLDAHLGRAGVGDLFVRLRDDPGDLRAALARTLRDPSLSLLYWLPMYGTWSDEEGRPARLPDGPDRVATVIERDGERVAALVHDPTLTEERELLDAVSAAAAIALENGRLRAELQARLEELRGSRSRVLEAGQRERQRLERDLHDGAQQRLIALSLDLGLLEHRLGADPDAKDALAQAKREIALSLDELRDVARGLHPAVLSGHGLGVALESLAARAPVPVTLAVRLDGRLAEPVEVAAYYVVCESIANIGKHARATSSTVKVGREGDTLVVEVVDDGIGGADTESGGTGLRGLADRVEALGGRLRVWTPPGRGTRVRAEIPCG
jgi:signal transduction histidine kinase